MRKWPRPSARSIHVKRMNGIFQIELIDACRLHYVDESKMRLSDLDE